MLHLAAALPKARIVLLASQLVHQADARPPLAAAAYEFLYESAATQSSYVLNTNPMNQKDAEQFCRDNGMHLVTWESRAEQNEVEVAFQSKFQLQPPYHSAYWMGLRIKKGAWNKTGFTPLDNAYALVYKEPNGSIYTNWANTEPNNARGNEMCSVGNWTMRNGTVETWGWQDAQCQQRLPAICKLAAPFDGETTNPCCGTKYTIHTKPVDASKGDELCR
jgi:hypothetical protein